jgi:hypothetical protein
MKYSFEKFKTHRVTENFHILLWLIKDTCWVLEIKMLGLAMILPAILMAVLITKRSSQTSEFYVNLSVFFWICANSFWMCVEFFDLLQFKYITAFPFALGFVAFGIYVYKLMLPDTNNK